MTKYLTIGIVILVIVFGIYSITSPEAFAHRSGCHRWHSCPSDTGSYTCGDTGYCSQCSDNNYCKAGQHISSSSGSSSSGTSSSGSSPSMPHTIQPPKQKTSSVESNQVTNTSKCDISLWTHVYHPQRLKIIESCKTVSGVIQSIKKENDGDYHIQLKLDPQFSSLINSANIKYQKGNLVLEPVCQSTVKQNDAKQACLNFKSVLNIPPKGSHVTVTGSYVLDLDHERWAEIHPVTSIQIIH